ncbi:MAG: CRISPR-associated endonuclease Cas2 [Deltaproteobacteria bacterium]|nr:CRISPR-associated endonuclease Cas2 [Deltaproteobacteria bacterium]MBW2018010.1 CRISPR-associated endonuclease Cas2 [Deltaproteobacteria bacterium]MBW2130177.1 CRISPR-associated endonuclease Cas2 [Deltaproteobacteria bacterium]MBW2304736.1 CRISPR-associated endonuclease Cas2 [Deltaproteobacteria bacterium]
MFCLVCFDIVDDRSRQRVVKVLKSYGERVQKSVFECPGLSEERFLKMKNSLEDMIDVSEDTIRYYHLCKACLRRFEFSGIGGKPEEGTFRIL